MEEVVRLVAETPMWRLFKWSREHAKGCSSREEGRSQYKR